MKIGNLINLKMRLSVDVHARQRRNGVLIILFLSSMIFGCEYIDDYKPALLAHDPYG
jgi:hypothetical protein